MTTAALSTDAARPLRLASLLAVLGIVYGDIGTSPLYALKASLAHFTATGTHELEIMGVLSLMFWALVLTVTLKYVLLIMRADNNGEGGILALMALAQRGTKAVRIRQMLGLLGISGACLFFGDGVITPAISVLSAVEGLQVVYPQFHYVVVPISIAVIVALFAVQIKGTGQIGRVFGPIMAVWFGSLAALGIAQIAQNPTVLTAVSPHYAFQLCQAHGWLAFVTLGSVVLAVTGAEALYADMGHFGAQPIRIAWLWFVLPALVLNYFGQGALVLRSPSALENPFYLLAPGLAAAAARVPVDGGDRDRQPGDDLRRLLHGADVHADVVPAAPDGAAHQPHRGGSDLFAADQLGAAGRRADPGAVVPQQRRAGGGVRHRGDRDVPVHELPGHGRVPAPVRLVAGAGGVRVRVLPDHRRHVLHLEPAEGPRRRLGAARARAGAWSR